VRLVLPGNPDEFRLVGEPAQTGDQRHTVHPRHHQIGDDKADIRGAGLHELLGLRAVGGGDHEVTGLFENLSRGKQDGGLVIDNEYQPTLPPAGALGCGGGRDFGSDGAGREEDLERRPPVRGAVDRDKAEVVLYDAEGRREAQAGTLPHGLRREIRIEYARANLRRDPVAGVRHNQDDVGPRLGGLMKGRLTLLEHHV